MFHMPTSSPMMTTMLGFFSCALAGGGRATLKSVANVAKAKLIFPFHFMRTFLFFFCSDKEIMVSGYFVEQGGTVLLTLTYCPWLWQHVIVRSDNQPLEKNRQED